MLHHTIVNHYALNPRSTATELRIACKCHYSTAVQARQECVKADYLTNFSGSREYHITAVGRSFAAGPPAEPSFRGYQPREKKSAPVERPAPHMIAFTAVDHATVKALAADHGCSMREIVMRAVDAYTLVQTFEARIGRLESKRAESPATE